MTMEELPKQRNDVLYTFADPGTSVYSLLAKSVKLEFHREKTFYSRIFNKKSYYTSGLLQGIDISEFTKNFEKEMNTAFPNVPLSIKTRDFFPDMKSPIRMGNMNIKFSFDNDADNAAFILLKNEIIERVREYCV